MPEEAIATHDPSGGSGAPGSTPCAVDESGSGEGGAPAAASSRIYRGSVDSTTVVMGMVTTLPMEAMATTVTVMITATITVDTSTSR